MSAPVPTPPRHPEGRPWRIGGVSYFNACPIFHDMDSASNPITLTRHVPSHLYDTLQSHRLDLALAPIADWLLAPNEMPLQWVPGGCIAGTSSSKTVILHHRVPLSEIECIHTDTDSHTSVLLLRLLMHQMTGDCPPLLNFNAGNDEAGCDAVLLIGDKNLHMSHRFTGWSRLDLAAAWWEWQHLPFVFATWLAPKDSPAHQLSAWLTSLLNRNLSQIPLLVNTYAHSYGWNNDEAEHYLSHTLSYELTEAHLQSVTRFHSLLSDIDLIAQPSRPLPPL